MIADDLTLSIKYIPSVDYALKLIKKIGQCSGLKISIDKIKAKPWNQPINFHMIFPDQNAFRTSLNTHIAQKEENVNYNNKLKTGNS